MELGIHFVNFTLPGAPDRRTDPAGTARAAEEQVAPVHPDGPLVPDGEFGRPSHDPMLEGYTSLGFLAARTERMTLGLLVSGVTYRHPGLLAK